MALVKVLPPCNYYSPTCRIKAEAYPSSAESDTASLALITSELFVSVPCAKGIWRTLQIGNEPSCTDSTRVMAYPRTLEVCFDISTTRRALTTVANALATNRKGVTSLHLATTDTEDLSMVQSLHNAGGAVAKTIRELTIGCRRRPDWYQTSSYTTRRGWKTRGIWQEQRLGCSNSVEKDNSLIYLQLWGSQTTIWFLRSKPCQTISVKWTFQSIARDSTHTRRCERRASIRY